MEDFITELKSHDLGNHILAEDKEPLGMEAWEELNRPGVWYREVKAGDIELWADTGYGRIALYDRITGEISLGKDFVSPKSYIGLLEYYTSDKPRLYEEVLHENQ